MTITIRRATHPDLDALALVAQATFIETFAGEIDGRDLIAECLTKRSAAHFASWLTEPICALWLAELAPGGAPIGYAGLSAPDLPVPTDDKDVELKRIYVLSRFHGSRAGAMLMDAALAWALNEGFSRMLIGVKADNNRALSFYRRNGFADIGTRRFKVGENYYDDLVLARSLAQGAGE